MRLTIQKRAHSSPPSCCHTTTWQQNDGDCTFRNACAARRETLVSRPGRMDADQATRRGNGSLDSTRHRRTRHGSSGGPLFESTDDAAQPEVRNHAEHDRSHVA